MGKGHEFKFKIDAFTPDTIPMHRLAEYMAQLAALLGEKDRVHFLGVEKGSAILKARVETPVYHRVRERVTSIRRRRAPKDALEAYRQLDDMLLKDNATAVLEPPRAADVVMFLGRERPKPVRYGPFWQPGDLDGILVRIGGIDESVPVGILVESGVPVVSCTTTREIAKRLAKHLYDGVLKVKGDGRWLRDESGTWVMDRFTIRDFEVLDDAPLADVIDRMREACNSLVDLEDPLGDLYRLRHSDGGVQ